MSISRLCIAFVAIATLVGIALVRDKVESPSDQMVAAADRFLATLTPEQKKIATFDFNDKERTNWHFIPMQKGDQSARKGLELAKMTEKQKKAAFDLLRAGTSRKGYNQATTIMSLEAVLHKLEKNGRFTRSPDWYHVSIFGKPSKNGQWGWRLEGHHLSLNFTLNKGKIVSATPAFFGSNPATLMVGKRKGFRALPECETLAMKLFSSLDKKQLSVAKREKHFPEVEQGKSAPNVGKAEGLAASQMTADQKSTLMKLVEAYARRMPPMVGREQLKRVKKAGVDKIHFAFSKPGDKKAYTYRVQGPTFVIEFLNTQTDPQRNPANHVHSVWRNIEGDFGLTN